VREREKKELGDRYKEKEGWKVWKEGKRKRGYEKGGGRERGREREKGKERERERMKKVG